MKYWGRSLIVYLAIITLLYGTKEVWNQRDYNRAVHGGPSHETFDYEPGPETRRRGEFQQRGTTASGYIPGGFGSRR